MALALTDDGILWGNMSFIQPVQWLCRAWRNLRILQERRCMQVAFSVTIYQVPDKLNIKEITLAKLLKYEPDWHRVIAYPYTQSIGDDWLRSRETAVLKVPSAIIDLEYNYLNDPAHPEFNKIKNSICETLFSLIRG